MKKMLTLLSLFLLVFIGFGQVPGAFNYQAVVRNSSGEVLANANVSFRISILLNTSTGTSAYVETQTASTNGFGLVNLKIGKGTKISGSFTPDNWGTNSHFMKVEVDPAGGSTYTQLGTTELLAVPYAFHAQTVENNDDADADATNEIQTLSINGTQLSLSKNGGTVTLPASGETTSDNWGTQTVVSDATLDGTGTTASPLTVVGDLTDNQTLSLSGNDLSITGGNTVTLPAGSVSPWTVSGNNIYRNLGFVGIGTDSPYSRLTLGGTGAELSFRDAATGATSSITWRDQGNDLKSMLNFYGADASLSLTNYATSGDIIINAKDKIELQQNGSTRLAVSSYGNIGIGNTNPLTNLVIEDESTAVGIQLFTTYSGSNSTDGLLLGYNAGGAYLHCYENSPIKFSTNNLARMVIASGGNVGIGTTAPTAGLHLVGTGYPSSFMYIQSDANQDAGIRLYEGTTAQWHIFNNSTADGLDIYNSGGQVAIFAKQSNSYVGLGTTSPTQKLHVVGNAYKTEGGTSWATSSDIRLKNLTGKYNKGLSEIIKLEPVRYIYKKDNPRQLNSEIEQVGFVAQEVQKIFPEAVTVGDDGYLDFNIHPINIAFVNAMKELKNENDVLKNKVDKLESRLEQLEILLEASAKK